MPRNEGFLTYVLQEVMQDIPGITSRSMFGGYGVYKDGIVFAMIIQDSLYFKVDETNKAGFEDAGSSPFMYTSKNRKPIAMSYWRVPEDVLENQAMILEWIEKAVQASRNKKSK